MGKILDASWHVDGIIVGSKGFFCNVAAMAMGFNKLSQHSLYDSWVSKENHKHFLICGSNICGLQKQV